MCSIKRFGRSVLCALLLISLSGCRHEKQDSYTLGQWIQKLVTVSGIQIDESQPDPYYLAAKGFSVIQDDAAYDPDIVLDRQWLAYTLVNLAQFDEIKDVVITDLDDSLFPDHIRRITDIMPLEDQKFRPEEHVSEEDALKYLNLTLKTMGDRRIMQTETEIEWNEEGQDVTFTEPSSVEDQVFVFQGPVPYEPGQIICDENGNIGRVTEITYDNDLTYVNTEEVTVLDLSDSMYLSGSTEVDFSKAEIIAGDGEIVQFYDDDDPMTNMSFSEYSKNIDLDGYSVSLSSSSTGFKAEVKKNLPSGSKAYANVRLSSLRCDYEWLSEKQDIRNVYLRLRFDTEENFGVRHTSYTKRYGDFSKIDPKDFISTAKNFFQDADHVVQKTLTLATVSVPIPNAPLMKLEVNVDLNIYVSGRVEITLHQAHEIGCEIRNSTVRMIQKMDPTHEEDIQASMKVTSGIRFGLKMTGMELCNVSLLGGAESSVKTSVHLYEKDGTHTTVQTDLPVDVVDDLAQGNGNVLVCADMDAHIIGEINVNSKGSLLGRMGLSRTITVLNNENASLLPKGYRHLENFHFVESCTRNDRKPTVEKQEIKVTGKITLERYALAMGKGGYRSIVVTGLPEGYSASDLIYTVTDSSVAVVSENGRVTGRTPGATEVKVETSDGKYSSSISILVTTS
ncbi:MAG: Ig domain-containing protein [Bulleidia sp.]